MADETAEWIDETGYPSDAALERIATWSHNDYSGLLDFAGSLWRWPDWWTRTGDTVYAATGGWSGNEDVINALKQNEVFWMQCWRYTLVGGGFGFNLPWQPGTPIRRAEDEIADRAIRERIAALTEDRVGRFEYEMSAAYQRPLSASVPETRRLIVALLAPEAPNVE